MFVAPGIDPLACSSGERTSTLELAAGIGIEVMTPPLRPGDANAALRDLAHDRVRGAAVLMVDPT
jgi:hypothetical protein